MRGLMSKAGPWALMTLVVGGVVSATLAQPPDKGRRIGEEYATVRGTIESVTRAPKGETDGVRLSDGTWIHWPPHLQDEFRPLAVRGDRVRAAGYWETGKKGERKFEVSTLTNLDTGKSVDNPDRPAAGGSAAATARRPDLEDRIRALEEKLDRLIAASERPRSKK